MKRKIFLKPPHYFFFCIILSLFFYSVFPSMNIIVFPWSLLGLVLLIKGGILIYLSARLFKKHKTTEDFSKSTYLIKEGIYRCSRNPMYLGALIFIFGVSVLTGNIISLICPAFFFLVINFMFIPFEEEKLELEFGQNYLDYKKRARRWV